MGIIANNFMKELKLIVLLSIVSINLFCQTDNSKGAVITIPKTHIDIYYVNLKPKIVNGNFYTGIDSSYFFEKNEKLLAIETFDAGFKTELKTFYDNGNPECHWGWKNGKRDGVSKRWYKSGQVIFDYIIKEGERIGSIIQFNENGYPLFIDDKTKTGIYMEFYKNGKLYTLAKHFNDSTTCGGGDGFEETYWYENGQLMLKRIENCGKQTFRWYHNDTLVASEGTAIGMSLFLVGNYTEWHKNGKIYLEAYYQDGNTQSEANIKTGTWRYWNEKGKLIKEEYYENNELKKTKTYIPEKKPVGKMEISLTQTPIDR